MRAARDSIIEFEATGADAQAAVAALVAAGRRKIFPTLTREHMSAASAALILNGRTASRGFARGPLVRSTGARRAASPEAAGGGEAALRRALAADEWPNRRLLAATIGGDAAEILEFQLALLEDESSSRSDLRRNRRGRRRRCAWSQALAEQIARLSAAPDEYLAGARRRSDRPPRPRARALNGEPGASGRFRPVRWLCAEDLPPSRFLEIDWSAGGGLALLARQPDQPCRDAGARARRSDGRAARPTARRQAGDRVARRRAGDARARPACRRESPTSRRALPRYKRQRRERARCSPGPPVTGAATGCGSTSTFRRSPISIT